MLRLVTPGMPLVAAREREGRSLAPMHDRFDANFIVNRVSGRRHRILSIFFYLDRGRRAG